MSIKKQSILLLAGFASLVAMSNASALKGAVEGAPAVAVENASAKVTGALTMSKKFVACTDTGPDILGNQTYQINTQALGVPTGVVAFNPEDDSDVVFVINTFGSCAGAPATAQ